jgi:hypothetical protein
MKTPGIAKGFEMLEVNLFKHPICFTYPSRVATSAWMGHVPFAMYIIDVLRPKAIVELGTHYGVSYCAFCQAVKELGLDTRSYAIDTWEGDAQSGFYGPEVLKDLEEHHNTLYGGFSRLIQSTFDEALKYFADHTFDLLHIDGFHTYEAVKQDFEKWLPKMTDRGVVLLHDINVREREFGVWKFWDEVKSIYPHFEFVHSHGLGVLAVGKHCPEGLKGLFQSSGEDAAKIRWVFSQLGERLESSKELKLIGPTIKELTASQKDKELQLQDKELQLQDKELQLQDKELQLQENVRQLQEKDTLIHQKNLEGISFNEKLQASDRLLAERDKLIHEKNLELISIKQAQELLLQEKTQLDQQHSQQLEEAIQQHQAKDLIIQSGKQEIEGYALQLETEKEKFGELEQQLQLKQRQLELKHRQLDDRDQLVQERDVRLSDNERRLQEVALQLRQRLLDLQNKQKLIELYETEPKLVTALIKVRLKLPWPMFNLRQLRNRRS